MASQPPPKLDFNPDEYLHHLDGVEITDEEAEQLLTALWHIMHTFVDIGWGLDSVQMFLPDIFEKASPDSDNSLKKNHNLKLVHRRVMSTPAKEE